MATIGVVDADWNGSETITFRATDPGALYSEDSAVFTVNDVNDVPSFTKGADQTVLENSGAKTVPGWATSISKGPANESGQTLTFNVTNSDNSLFSAQPAVNASSGNLTFTPATNASGSVVVTVALQDNGGTDNGGVDTSPPQTFNITVQGRPVISLSTATLNSTITYGTNAADQTFTLKNDNLAKDNELSLTYSISENSAGGWIASVTPVAGTNPLGPGVSDSITVAYNTTGLTPGIYGAVITVTDTNGWDTPETIAVTMTVNPIITVSSGANGSIDPAGPSVAVPYGTDQTFIISPDTANDFYIITDVLADGSSVLDPKPNSGTTTYTFTNVTANGHTISASFDDHGAGVCIDPTPSDDIVNYVKSDIDLSTTLEFTDTTTLTTYTVGGSIDPAGDRDFFKIIIPSGGGILTLYTTGDTDTHGTLLTSDCEIIATHDDINGTNNPNFRIERNMSAGTYYLQVREGFDTGTGSYTLSLTLEPDDHADTCENSAHQLACDADSVAGEIKPAGDRDFFKLVLTESKLVTVYTTSGGQMDTYGVIYDDNCDVIAHNNDASANDKDFYIEWQLQGPDAGETERVYYIGVRHLSATETGTYTLHVECAEAFSINSYANFGGTVSPQGIVIVGAGSNPSFEINATFGNTISDIIINGESVNDLATAFPGYTFTRPDGDLDKNVDTSYTIQFNNIDQNWAIQAEFLVPPELCVDISDTPLDARMHAAPANIMVLLDDSQSMDWEIMTLEGGSTGVSAGQMTIGNKAFHYLYNMEDRVNKTGQGSNVLTDAEDRRMWKSQWQGHNKVYYKSGVTYSPWPTKLDVDPNNPPSKPNETEVIANMSETYVSYGDTSSIIIVDNADTAQGSNPDPFIITGDSWDTATNSQAYGEDDVYYWTAGTTNPDDYSATWVPPDIPASEYEVFVRYVSDAGRWGSVPYTITYAGGATTTVTVNQTKNGGTWVSLGIYNFDEGAGNVAVTLTNYDITTTGTVSIDAVKFQPTNLPGVLIPIAHYYQCEGSEEIIWLADNQDIPYTDGTSCNGQPWLVIVDEGTIRYFQFNDAQAEGDDGYGRVDNGELTEFAPGDVPATIRTPRTYEQERQNFANWFTYYRKRDLLTRAAVSRVVTTLKGVNVGFRGLEGTISIPVKPVKVAGADESSSMLEEIYTYPLEARGAATSSSPVRRAFEDVGQYFDKSDGAEDGGIGPSPIASQEDGGGCQQNFVIIFSDAYYNGLPAGSLAFEDDDSNEFSGFPPYISNVTNTMADIAMNYYARDLAPEVEDQVPVNPFDSARHQHLVTYSVTFGVIGTLSPDDYDLNACEEMYISQGDVTYPPCPPWPQINSDTKKIDDLWHAAVNGRGEFFSANDVNELIEAFRSVLENIEARIGSAASVSVNGDELYGVLGEDVRMYQSSYSTDGWIGDVKSYELDQQTGQVITTSYVFSAAAKLEEKGWQNRVIATYDGTSAGIPFNMESLTNEQKEYLYSGWEESGVTVSEIVNYLRGDESRTVDEGGEFRNRLQIFGDVVHSSPLFVNGLLYTGGNDGMLHAFSAEDGEELFSYVPNLIFENLNMLPDPNYRHLYYVDLTPASKVVQYTSGEDTVNKTILMGGLGKGGKGYYCLDISGVTDETVITESALAAKVMWEFPRSGVTDADINDLGFSFSRPAIVKSYDDNYPWIAIFGNGYNSMSSHAVLFIMNPLTGDLIKKIDTGIVVEGGSQCNGMSTPIAIDHNFDGKVDYVYAGDLYGNMWKFDLTDTDYMNWGVAYGVDTNYDGVINYNEDDGESADVPAALFTARDPLGIPQPITTKPDVMKHCGQEGFMVIFGTGRYLGETDFLNYDIQSMYGIWDFGDDDDDSEYLGTFQRTSSQKLSNLPAEVTLLQQTEIPGNFTTASGQSIRILTDHAASWITREDEDSTEEDVKWPNPGSALSCDNGEDDDEDGLVDEEDQDECPASHAGWYVDVPPGERVANDLIIREGKVVMIGFQPEQTPCGTGGSSVVMELDACSGGRLDEPQLDITEDNVIDSSDLVNIGTEENPEYVAPTGVEYEGRLMPPAILRTKDEEIKYFSTNVGSIVTLREKAVTLGMTYWKEFE
ncbi:PilC/PilY family type IV pilus protein [Thermodesulfobacteriota bacterium]